MKRNLLLLAIWAIGMGCWALWTEYRVQGLEIRMNVHEASEHWQDEPPQ